MDLSILQARDNTDARFERDYLPGTASPCMRQAKTRGIFCVLSHGQTLSRDVLTSVVSYLQSHLTGLAVSTLAATYKLG